MLSIISLTEEDELPGDMLDILEAARHRRMGVGNKGLVKKQGQAY